ncbi:PepSY domain-containing protein, partial [Singulisphaera rosea]
MYRVLWRWQFYAGVLVSPVLLVVAMTGAIYVFRSEIEDARHARHRFVVPQGTRLGAQALVDAARATQPSGTPTSLELPSDPSRSTIVRFAGPKGQGDVPVYVDPYRGRVL